MLTKYEEEEKDITEINIESIEVVRDNDIGNADNTTPQLRTFYIPPSVHFGCFLRDIKILEN